MNHLLNTVQTEFNIESNLEENRKLISRKTISKKRKNINLTPRDYEVIKFLLDMKFASLDEIHFKFFKNANPDGKEVGTTYVIKRLIQLKREGYLHATKAFDATKTLFYPSMKAYVLLDQLFPEESILRPLRVIDGRTVVHDYYLLQLRLKLEENQKVSSWISDRRLRVQTGLYSALGDGNTPDGVYTDSNGSKVAFELEVSIKAKARYEDKIKKYVTFIRDNPNNPEAFKTVHYIVFTENTFRHLTNYSALYKNFFKIEMASAYNLQNGVRK